MVMPGTYPIQHPIRAGHLGGDGPPHPLQTPGTEEWMRRLGALPPMYQPGEQGKIGFYPLIESCYNVDKATLRLGVNL